MKQCPHCGAVRPDPPDDPIAAKVWDWLHTPPGEISMTWPELRAATNEFAQSGNLLWSLMAAASV